MARQSRPTQQKRAKERARQERQKEKEARRLLNKERRSQSSRPRVPGEDPDIAGIRPGPQPRPPEWDFGTPEEDEGEA